MSYCVASSSYSTSSISMRIPSQVEEVSSELLEIFNTLTNAEFLDNFKDLGAAQVYTKIHKDIRYPSFPSCGREGAIRKNCYQIMQMARFIFGHTHGSYDLCAEINLESMRLPQPYKPYLFNLLEKHYGCLIHEVPMKNKVYVIKDVKKTHRPQLPKLTATQLVMVEPSEIELALKRQFLNDFRSEPTNLQILVDGEVFAVHQFLLKSSSEYFEKLIEKHTPGTAVSLYGVTKEAFALYLKLIYGEEISIKDLDINHVLQLLQLSTMYLHEDIRAVCCYYIDQMLVQGVVEKKLSTLQILCECSVAYQCDSLSEILKWEIVQKCHPDNADKILKIGQKLHLVGLEAIAKFTIHTTGENFYSTLTHARKGCTKAQAKLAGMYRKGELVEKDYQRAFKWAIKATDEPEASFVLGKMYDFGEGVSKDYDRARYYYQIAADQKHPFALNNLGRLYLHGKNVERNYPLALRCFQQASKSNIASAFNNLGIMYQMGYAVRENHKEALRLYEYAAALGDENALTSLGRFHRYGGLGLIKNKSRGFRYYQMAANNGHTDGLVGLGDCYKSGDGCKQDHFKAFDCYERAAKLKSNRGMWHLGLMYLAGKGVEKNVLQAEKWLVKAAELGGSGVYASSVAELYLTGKTYGIDAPELKKAEKGFFWHEKAVTLGHGQFYSRESCYQLGRCYRYGIGTERDDELASEWFKKAADLGCLVSSLYIGSHV